MDVLELPRPVINFLRTMSKEMNRYSLCWDIYGGSESVTLTLTWKINEQIHEKEIQINGSVVENKVNKQFISNLEDSTKLVQQQKSAIIKNNKNSSEIEQVRPSRKPSEEVNDEAKESHPRGKSADLTINNKKKLLKSKTNHPTTEASTLSAEGVVKNEPININRLNKTYNGSFPIFKDSSVKQCPPPSVAYIKRKSTDQKVTLLKQHSVPVVRDVTSYHLTQTNDSNDPWIRRNNQRDNLLSENNNEDAEDEDENNSNSSINSKCVAAVVTKLDSNNSNDISNSNEERKLSLQATDASLNQIKVTFDPTLHYI